MGLWKLDNNNEMRIYLERKLEIMGWYGDWNIKYNGKDSDKFVNLAKMIIPNYVKRF